MQNNPKFFEKKIIRTAWNEQEEEWYFSIVDVVGVLTETERPRKYWSDLKKKLQQEGCEVSEKIGHLKMLSADGKMRLTDVANTEQLLRIIQSVPSKKAEPFKQWLAEVGRERIEEVIDPELTIDRALETYLKKGYSNEWIKQRLRSIQDRKELTDAWEKKGVKKGIHFAILTDEITKAWSGMTTRGYKTLKGLKKENLRDNMTTTEIILNMLAETATKEISKQENPNTFDESKKIAQRGGKIAGNARMELEKEIGHTVISDKNASEIHSVGLDSVVTNLIENTSQLSDVEES